MSVEDWARKQAETWYPTDGKQSSRWNAMQVQGQAGANRMARNLADALLSDEAVEAAAFGLQPRLYEYPYTESDRERYRGHARAALRAAITAVTEGDTE